VASTYCTVTVSPGLAVAPVPTMRLALSNRVGGAPAGTVMVGGVPVVPAGDRSWTGTVATVSDVLDVVAVPVVVVVLDDEELLHPANPRAASASTAADHVCTRDMHGSLPVWGFGGTGGLEVWGFW
jgi:hypothetical protein